MKPNSFIILIAVLVSTSNAYSCLRTPKKAENPKPNYNRYVIDVFGTSEPGFYSPGQKYTVVLRSNPQNPINNSFTKFMLVVEPEQPVGIFNNALTGLIGELNPLDPSVAGFTPECPGAIIQTNNLLKSSVEVEWTAPPSGNTCIEIKATVYESSDSWYADDGGLTKKLCEEGENKDDQGLPSERCCACNEAKYEVAFQGMWTRNTHPKEYPANMWDTKLGEVIGASHTYSKAFWNYNTIASEGLKDLAEKGDTSRLENELKELVKSDDIRTIIKARELPYPNITGTSYTVFRVDPENHLVSLVSKITPSPDWIVGVANLDLCLPDCQWREHRTLNLYPWDIGTNDGTTYTVPGYPTEPVQPVTRITSDMKNYSPFYNTDEPVKPIAQLTVTRQKLYEKTCDTTEDTNQVEDEVCRLTEWSEWSSCSTTCDNNVHTRDRQLVTPENEAICTQNDALELQQTERCTSDGLSCEPTECSNAQWSKWSLCNATCGTGYKTRYGTPISADNNEEIKETEEPGPCEETVECYLPDCEQETTTTEFTTSVNGILSDNQKNGIVIEQGADYNLVVNCKLSLWSEWGPCEGTPCQRGYQYKERHIKTHPANGGKACPKKLRKEKRCKVPCSGETAPKKATEHRPLSSETVNCLMGPWTEWTPCSKTCGTDGVQIRTRTVEVQPKGGGLPCGPRLQENKCLLPYACDDREWKFLNSA